LLTHPMLDQLAQLGLPGMAQAFAELETSGEGATLTHADWLGLLVDREVTHRRDKRLAVRLRHARLRHHAVVEDRIRCGKDTGLANLPFRAFQANTAWLELVLIAQDLLVWTQRLLLSGELARCEPKRLRYRLLHVAGRLTQHARRLRLHLPRGWAWGESLLQAFTRLRALPQAP